MAYLNKEIMETGLEIAVIGMAGRFPGARNIAEFWNNLKNGVETITFFSTEELEEAGCDPSLVKNPNYVKAMGFLQDIEYFDGSFFGYTPMEIEITDPQMRIFHECAWEALEDAGYDPGTYSGRIGFYSGGESSSFWETLTNFSPIAQYVDPLILSNLNNKDYLSTRISYKFNLRGPTFTIHTACSTSLVAIHLAVQGLLNGESEMALAGGVRLSLPGKSGYLYQEGMINSPDGHCRAFDAKAKGTVGGDGAGLVVLKSLEEATADGDNIYAVIKGSAINNDGVRKVGFHAPSIDGQSEVISAALYTAEVEPESIGYIETHGTGTELGDTVEIEALKLSVNSNQENSCAIGSVKTNIGHLGCAAGVAGFIKTVLVLKHRLIPPSLHFEKPNPKIDFKNSPFYVNTHLKAWQTKGFPLRAGVSSFGIGGANAHVVLEAVSPKYRLSTGETPARPYQLFLLSARTQDALAKMTQNLANYLKENPGLSLADAAYTLQVGRKRFAWRRKLVFKDTAEAIALLTSPDQGSAYGAQAADENRKVIFMFPGLGPQYVNMGEGLYQTEPFFREEMDRCFEILKPLGYDLKIIIYPSTDDRSGRFNINELDITQLMIFAIEYALAKLVMHWGIRPYAMIGYSFGEYVAACLAGVFSLEAILKLLVIRGKLFSQLPSGKMLSVPLPVETVIPLLPGELSIGIDNGSSCVVSGPGAVVEWFAKQMKENKLLCTPFESPYAAHSQMLDPLLEEFKKEVANISLNSPQIPYISTVTGTWITFDDARSPGYWAKQLRSTVYFVKGIRKILAESQPLFLEMGPGRDMSSLVNREIGEIDDKTAQRAISLVKHRGVQKEITDEYYLLDKIGRLWLYGVNIDWQAFHSDYPDRKRYRVSLPAYPFERQRYWKIIDDYKAGTYIFQRGVPNSLESVGVYQGGQPDDQQPIAPGQEGYGVAWYSRPQLSTLYVAPQDVLQQTLVSIWQRLFGIKEIGIRDDFFELGGDSLKAINVLSTLHKETNRLVPLKYFFDNPTIERVATYSRDEETGFVSIQALEKKEYYPLSSAQKRMYFFQQVDLDSIAYNNVLANVIEGDIDTGKLTEIFKKLVKRHDSLRTSFIEVNGELVQRIHEDAEFEIEYKNIATDEHGQTRPPGGESLAMFMRPFDLTQAPLLRVGLVKVREQEHILMVDMHHVISDGTSIAILIEEFMAIDQGKELPALWLQYKDYAAWQRQEMEGGALAQQRDYWLKEFAGEIPALDLPYDYVRTEVRTFSGKVLQFDISIEETRALNRLASGQGATLYMALLGITDIFLARLSGQETVVVGTPIAGRTHADLDRIIGMFVNTLAMKNELAGEKTVQEFLIEVKEKTLSAFANQEYQYEELVEHLPVDRSSGRNPLFDTLFTLQNVEIRGMDTPSPTIQPGMNLKIKPLHYEQAIAKFDLSIECFERNDVLFFNLEYGTELFTDETAARFAGYFKKILSSVVERPTGKIAGIEIISEEEKEQVLFQFNNTDVAYPTDKTIHQLFAEQAAKTPDRIALVGHAGLIRPVQLAYRQLNEQSDRLAGLLSEKGIRADNIVGLMIERSIEMIIGIIGILKSGGAYLPIAPDYPQERIDYMLKDSNAKIIVGNRYTCCEESNCQLSIVNCELLMSEREALFHHSNLAYLIYTSGSTGKPKGVLIDHRAVVNRLYYMRDCYRLDANDVVLQKTSVTFDVSVCELFRWILPGAKLCLLPIGGENQPEVMLDFMAKHQVTTVDFVPSALNVFLEFMTAADVAAKWHTLRWVFIGAEVVRPGLVVAFNKIVAGRCKTQLINGYGPTEATVDVTYFNCSSSESLPIIPIGKPIPNVRLVILDKNGLHLQPIGIPGELCIGGHSLAQGYLNNPELTAEKFDKDKKSKSFYGGSRGAVFSKKAPLVYKTGDLARWLPDGNIEFLGRIDHQVKIRGFRVELGEIENCLLTINGIKEALVLALEETRDDKYLCAYFVPDREYEVPGLREQLARELPEYMMPTYLMRLERFPLTATGKIDRRALPLPEFKTGLKYVEPGNEIERKLVKLWAEILGRDSMIGIDDNFFQLGGHSLKATTLMSRIHKELEVKVELMEIFRTPTIRDIARLIQGLKKEIFQAITPVEKKEYYPLSSAQKRLYFLQQLDLNSTGYNMPMVLPLGQGIKKDKLEFALKQLIARHESLRTSIERVNEDVVQRVHENVEFEIEYYEKIKIERFIRSFDLSKAPLMRSALITVPDGNYVWIVDIHHIVSDGTSHTILTDDFMRLYETGIPMEPLSIQYKDFAQWQNQLFAGGGIKNQEDYWLQLYAGEIPRLNLAADYKRPGVFTFAGDSHLFKLEVADAVQFKALGARYGGTLYMNSMAVLNTLFYKYTGQTDIIIGSGIAGRRHADIQGVVGMFVNTLAMRNYPAGEKPYEDFLKEVIANSVTGFENQDAQFEELVEKLDPERDPSRNPLFDVTMVVQNFNQVTRDIQGEIANENLPASRYKNKTAKFDLTFFVTESEADVYINLEYYTAIFKEETIQRLAAHFKNVVHALIKNPTIALKDIDILSEKEKEQLLYEFNDTNAEFPRDKTIHRLIEEQVARTPHYSVLVYKDQIMSYQELDRQANCLAHYLSGTKGVGIGEPVGVWMSEPLFRQVALIGILKAGGAFVPIDPAAPTERIKYIINDTRIGVMISEKQRLRDLNRLQWECVTFHSYLCIDSVDIDAETEKEENQLMDLELWQHVGVNATDEITGGGWLSSYTGLPISSEEMDEYGDNILKKLEPLLHPKLKVLEIGCASGISMYRIAPKVGLYYGTDLSEVIIEKNKSKVRENGFYNIQLACLPAHEIDHVPVKDFDLVIINSVVQCFHGHNYLRKVLQKAINLLGDNGYLFIGDVMNQEKKDDLVRELTAFKEANKHKGYTTKTDFSAELFVSPGFWQDLEAEWREIETVTCSDKRFSIENELTKFRYDVLMKVSKTGNAAHTRHEKLKYRDDMRAVSRHEDSCLSLEVLPGHLAYIIYTSGSTGKPKGVMVEHRSLVNLCQWHNTYYTVTSWDRVTRYAGFGFDASVWEFFPSLVAGAAICIVPEEIILDIELLNYYYEKNGVTVSFLPTQMAEQFMTINNMSLRLLQAAGDRLKKFVKRNYQLYNCYGPTENTVCASSYPVTESSDNIPIGMPIYNNRIYVMDMNQHLQPIGASGELYIGGESLARGYLNNPELTADKFNRPHQSYRSSILYKTGDLARWLPDGNIEFLGRIDQQVKIRGFRIEPGEIEARLLKHHSVKASVVIERTDNGETYLCAYIVCLSNEALDPLELGSYLSRFLPGYMMPNHFIKVDHIPVTVNGKVDKKALPMPQFTAPGEYIAPVNDIENKLAFIWSDVLAMDREKISMAANFFQLGGHSLKATLLVSKIHKELHVKIPLAEIFNSPTIRELAKYIKGLTRELHVSIKPVEKREYYILSSAQKRMYFLQQFDLKGVGYNMPLVLPLGKGIEKEKLEATLRQLIERHESLRTSFERVNDEVVQRIHESVEFEIEYLATDEHGQTRTFLTNFIRPFDLSQAPLIRSGLIKLPDGNYTWLVDMHHIISDGTSHTILTEDFMAGYSGKELKPLLIQYKDFALWQHQQFETGEIKVQMEYWLDLLAGEIPRLNLPVDYNRPRTFTFAGDSYGFVLRGEEVREFKGLGSRGGGTLYMNMLAALNVLFYKYTGQNDIIIGSGIEGRRHADSQGVVGMFVNTLAMRNYPDGEKSYESFLKEVIAGSVRGFENQDVQFEDLVDNLDLERDASRNPVFDIMMMVQNFRHSSEELLSTRADENPALDEYKNPISKFDMTFFVDEQGDDISVNIEYYTAGFKLETIQRMASYLKIIIKAAATGSLAKIKDIEIISDDEKKKLIYEFNDTGSEYPKDKSIHQLFAEQVEKTPGRSAIFGRGHASTTRTNTDNTMVITYRELHEQSNRLACLLSEKGFPADNIVAIMAERSIEQIIAILGILKSGGAYMPIDPEYPADRIDYMLKDSAAKLLVTTNNKESEKVKRWEGEKILLEEIFTSSKNSSSRLISLPPYLRNSSSLAYVIYTSGTTGRPKGSLIEHMNVARLLFNDKFQFDFSDHDVWTLFHSFCFDFSVWEMYGALLYGGKLVIVPRMMTRDTVEFLELLSREVVTVLNQTPAAFYNLINECLTSHHREHHLYIKYVIFGGDALNPLKLKAWQEKYPQTRLINMFGITETTVHTTYKEITGKDMKSNINNIGKPIPTLSTYILDKYLNPVPQGVTGEIWVGGDGVARGYLNQLELTGEKFIRNPYRLGCRVYRSGDMGRLLENGDMEYLGRIDHQVKIRGFRIELGEIENRLVNHAHVKEASVEVKTNEDGDKYLCAYIVSSQELNLSQFKEYLAGTLPGYMMPSYYTFLEKIPLTPNGKIDRKALPQPGREDDVYVAPVNEIETTLVAIWAEVLHIDKYKISTRDNFFNVGGHSLKTMTLASLIHKEFNVKIPQAEVFLNPTVKGLANYISKAIKTRYDSIEPVEKKEYYVLSHAQKRLYILQQVNPLSAAYNMPQVIPLPDGFDAEKLAQTFRRLIRRHESLRTSFQTVAGQLVQKVHEPDEMEFKIEHPDIIMNFARPFDLSRAPLLRVGLVRVAAEKYFFMVDIHHIISDGVSHQVLQEDFTALYEGNELPPLRIQYKDFAEWQNSPAQLENIKQQEVYWLQEFAEEIPVLELPFDFPRPETPHFEGEAIDFSLDEQLLKALRIITSQQDVTMYMMFLALFNVLLARLCGQEDIVIGTASAGRRHADLQALIGMFVNTLALRNYPQHQKSFSDFLQETKQRTLAAFENQDYPFEDLVDKVAPGRNINRNPLFDIMFNFLEFDEPPEKEPLTGLENEPAHEPGNDVNTSKFDMTFTISKIGADDLHFNIRYSTQLFKNESIREFIQAFKEVAADVVAKPGQKIAEIKIASQLEKEMQGVGGDSYADLENE